jgi:molybdopterin-containing oxidoreductase family iron-sulfur binding subunit
MIKRRDFLKTVGISGSAALLDACSPENSEKLVPYLVPPEDIVPGIPAYYTTSCRECPAGCGMLAKTREGRVIKVEGNPRHPVGKGKLCIRGQASVQSLYNPDRFKGPLRRNEQGQLEPIEWDQAEELLISRLTPLVAEGDQQQIAWMGRLMTGSMAGLIRQWLGSLGSERLLFYETFQYEALRRAAEKAFGRLELPQYHLQEAQFLISFGADFLETWRSNVEFTSDFHQMRSTRPSDAPDNFVYLGSRLSLTGSNADWWIPLRPGSEAQLALSIAHSIMEQGLALDTAAGKEWILPLLSPYSPESTQESTGVEVSTVRELARRLCQKSPSLALGGGISASGEQAVSLELAVLLLNTLAGNVGKTVRFGTPSALDQLASYQEILDLVQEMDEGKIQILFLHHGDPVFTLPTSSGFSQSLGNVPFVVSFSSLPDETTPHADLILPDHHFLESWGDYSPRSGVMTIQQPAMQPVFDTKATADVLLSTAQKIDSLAVQFIDSTYSERLYSHWDSTIRKTLNEETSWEEFWSEVLTSGGHFQEPASVEVDLHNISEHLQVNEEILVGPEGGKSLVLYPSPHFFDGRNANNPWLHEIPDPTTQLVWDSWVEVHPETARELILEEGDVVELNSPYGALTAPVHLYDGLHPDVVAIQLGRGKSADLRYASGKGGNPMQMISPEAAADSGSVLWRSVRVGITKTGERHPLVSLQSEGGERPEDALVSIQPVEAPAAAQRIRPSQLEDPDAHSEEHGPVDYYPAHRHPDHQWSMSIDLDACTGCNACAAACYAENNVPVVGRELCSHGREMSWLRIERHQAPLVQETDVVFPDRISLPVLCQHCHNAPCEPVCPVFATYHNPEGLNAQVYARCVGTRYCSNNCPYKVRRFNWHTFTVPEPLQLQLNPDVTTRTAGVMEKCSFCVQRIQEGKNRARREDGDVRDGDVTPACAQTCPADAIVFGDLNDPESRVSRMADHPRGYHILEQLNTRPAVTYLKKLVPEKPFSGE